MAGPAGHPLDCRHALARTFVAKAVLDLPTTSCLIDRLTVDATLGRLCSWERASKVPSEITFSLAFAEFAASALASHVHKALIKTPHNGRVIGHISCDTVAIPDAPVSAAAIVDHVGFR